MNKGNNKSNDKIDLNAKPVNREVISVLEGALQLANEGSVAGIVVCLAFGPERAGKAVAAGGLNMTLAGVCMDIANELSHRPFAEAEKSSLIQPVPGQKLPPVPRPKQ